MMAESPLRRASRATTGKLRSTPIATVTLFDATFRITDKGNGPTDVGPSVNGTVTDLPLRFSVPCVATSSTTVGSTCTTTTTINSVLGSSAIVAGQRAIWQLNGDVKLYDGGADGVASTTADNTLFAVGGLFFP
jgi:hypothetical protein